MDGNIKRCSAAYYVHVTDRRTEARLDEQMVFPIPKQYDYIIYNETPDYRDKYEGRPNRGIGTVKAVLGCNVCIDRISEHGNIFTTSVTTTDFRQGLYRFVQLSKLPDRLVQDGELDIRNLPPDLQRLVVFWPSAEKCLIRPS